MLDEKYKYTSGEDAESIISKFMASEPQSEYNVAVNIKHLMKIFYTDMRFIHANMGERLQVMKPLIDTL